MGKPLGEMDPEERKAAIERARDRFQAELTAGAEAIGQALDAADKEDTQAGPFTAALEAQGVLEPGEEGYWKVWGARAVDIQPGDLVYLKYADLDEPSEYEVAERAPRGGGHLMDTIRPRFRSTDGELFDVGALQAVVVLRKGTHYTLADSVR